MLRQILIDDGGEVVFSFEKVVKKYNAIDRFKCAIYVKIQSYKTKFIENVLVVHCIMSRSWVLDKG